MVKASLRQARARLVVLMRITWRTAMLLSIAWRNLWRNRRRTLTAVAAVSGGVAVMVLVTGLINGMNDRMLEAVTGSFLGHAQVHREGYRAKRSPTLTVADADRVLTALEALDEVEAASGRVYGHAQASLVRGDDEEIRRGGGRDVATAVVALVGVEPTRERAVTDLAARVIEGRWLDGEAEVVLGAGVARRTGARLGDALLPTSVDVYGATRGPWAVGDEVPRVVGILRSGVEELDGRSVLVHRSYLARLIRVEGQVHEVAIRARRPGDLAPLILAVEGAIERARAEAGPLERLPATAPLRLEGPGGSAGLTARLIGVEPTREGGTTPQGGELRLGRYLHRSEDIVLSAALTEALGVEPGDRVTVEVPVDCGPDLPASQCPPSEEPFVVAGVLPTGSGLLDDRFALISREVLLGNLSALAPSAIVELEGDEARRGLEVARQASGAIAATDEVLPWDELVPEIRQIMTAFEAAPVVMVIILFLAVSIGIVNTLMMATFERIKELGLMKALGMRPGRIIALVLYESSLLALVGIALGGAAGLALVGALSRGGLDLSVFMSGEGGFEIGGVAFDTRLRPSLSALDLLKIALPVALMTTLAGLFPAAKAARVQVTDAMRHE